jgi:hypothetical protein
MGGYDIMYMTKDSGKRVKYPSGFNRDLQDGKPRYDLIYLPCVKRLAELLQRGAVKYGENNWKLAKTEEEFNRFKASAFRHFYQYMNNENDEDHMAAVTFNLFAMEYMKDEVIRNAETKINLDKETKDLPRVQTRLNEFIQKR